MNNNDIRRPEVQGGAGGIEGLSSGSQSSAMSAVINHEGGSMIAPTGRSRAVDGKDVPVPADSHVSDKDRIKLLKTQVEFFESVLGFKYKDLVEDSIVKVEQSGTRTVGNIHVHVRNIKTPGSITGPELKFNTRFKHAMPLLGGTASTTASVKVPKNELVGSNDNIGTSSVAGYEPNEGTKIDTATRNKQSMPVSGDNSSTAAADKVTKKHVLTSNEHADASHDASSTTARAQAIKKKKKPASNNRIDSSSTQVANSNFNPTKSSSSNTGKALSSVIPAKRSVVGKVVGQHSAANDRRRAAAAMVDRTRQKPSYSTMCNREAYKGVCDRKGCVLLHTCQLDYLESQAYIDDGRPWAQTPPYINAFSDLREHPNPKSFS